MRKLLITKQFFPTTIEQTKKLAEIQKSVSLATTAILRMSNAALQYQQQPFEPKTFLSLDIDAMTVLGKARQLILVERKDKLKPALNKDIRRIV